MRRFLCSSVLACACAIASLVCSSPSRDLPEPGDERPFKDPFTPYEIGDPAAVWTSEDLTAEEQAVAERGRDVGAFPATHDAFGAAGAELAVKAAVAAKADGAKADGGRGDGGRGAIGGVP